MAKVAVDTEPTLDEAKAAIQFCRSYGGRESIKEYLDPLREFLAVFGSIERFDFVLEKATEAFGVELSEEQKARLKKPTPKKPTKTKTTAAAPAVKEEPQPETPAVETTAEGATIWKGN